MRLVGKNQAKFKRGICSLNYCENSKLAFSTLNSITAKGIKIVGRVWLGFEHSNMFHSQNGDNLIFWRQIRKTMILGVLLFLSVTFDTYIHILYSKLNKKCD